MQSSHRPCNLLCPVAPSAATAPPRPHQRPPHLLGTPPQRLFTPPSCHAQTRVPSGKTPMFTSSSPAAAAGNPQPFKLILGSSSVARKDILNQMGFEFQVMTADIDERSIRREDPEELVMVLAEAKADAIMSRMNISDYQKEGDQPTLLITSDILTLRWSSMKALLEKSQAPRKKHANSLEVILVGMCQLWVVWL